jgi:hypothetical protein
MSEFRPPRYLKPMNKFMMAVQKLGIPTGPAMVLTVPGRKTGKPRSTPMTPFEHDGRLYVVAGYPGADWASSARGRRGDTLARTQIATHQGRRTRCGGIRSGAADIRGQGAGRRRVRQTRGPRARRRSR